MPSAVDEHRWMCHNDRHGGVAVNPDCGGGRAPCSRNGHAQTVEWTGWPSVSVGSSVDARPYAEKRKPGVYSSR